MTTLAGLILIGVLIVAIIFVLTNGLHDASSVVATFIACGAGSPTQAVMLASVFGLIGAVTGGSAVANTVSSIVNIPKEPELLKVLLAALIGAVVWNVVTWQTGIPSSSTHALVGGLVGAVWVSHGANHVLWGWHLNDPRLSRQIMLPFLRMFHRKLLEPYILWPNGAFPRCKT